MHHEALDAFALAPFASRKSVSAFTEKVQRRRNSTGEGRWDGAARASFTLRLRVSRVTLRHRGEPGHTPKTQPRTGHTREPDSTHNELPGHTPVPVQRHRGEPGHNHTVSVQRHRGEPRDTHDTPVHVQQYCTVPVNAVCSGSPRCF